MALGCGVGAYGTLIGAGGGFVLIPLLLILYPKESPEILTSISLAVVFFNALSGSEAYGLMKRIDYRSGLMFAAATVSGVVVGAMNTSHVPRYLFDILFCVLMVAAAVFLIFCSGAPKATSKQPSSSRYRITRHLVDAHGHQHDYSFNGFLGTGLSMFVGYTSSFLGIGGDHPCSGSRFFLTLPDSGCYQFPLCRNNTRKGDAFGGIAGYSYYAGS